MRLLLLALFLALLVIRTEAQEWAGADELAEEAVRQISPHYEPWFQPVFEPPSGEIESLLFSVQSAIGGLLIGYFLGRYANT
ncbi:MAG: energy-coupling factor ABC transporter substrate-binding protein [Archaeoglobaceae archaeon]